MYIDSQDRLWTSAALTTTAVSTNCYDLHAPFRSGATQPDPTAGALLALVVNVETAGAHAGTETYEFQVINASATDLTTGQIVLATTGTIATADVAVKLAAGVLLVLPIPPGVATLRYLGAKIVSANSAAVTVSGEFRAVNMLQEVKYYPSGFTIS
jgi:hypothetical protein